MKKYILRIIPNNEEIAKMYHNHTHQLTQLGMASTRGFVAAVRIGPESPEGRAAVTSTSAMGLGLFGPATRDRAIGTRVLPSADR